MLQTSRFSLILTFSESGISAFINVMQDSENNVSWVTKQSCKNIKISGWECAITQVNLANRRSAFSDLELATRDFCQFQPSECSSQLKKSPARVRKKLHLLSAGKQWGSKLCKTEMAHLCAKIASAFRNGHIPTSFVLFLSNSFISSGGNTNTEPFLCHYPHCALHRCISSSRKPHLWEMKAGSKIQSFHLLLVMLFIIIGVLINQTREDGNGTSFSRM